MSVPARGLPIFARTFLLVLGALLVAQSIGVALLLMRPPVRDESVQLSEVVALLSTRMPSGRAGLTVHEVTQPPQPRDGRYHQDDFTRHMLARWLQVDSSRVRFYATAPALLPVPSGPGPWDNPPPHQPDRSGPADPQRLMQPQAGVVNGAPAAHGLLGLMLQAMPAPGPMPAPGAMPSAGNGPAQAWSRPDALEREQGRAPRPEQDRPHMPAGGHRPPAGGQDGHGGMAGNRPVGVPLTPAQGFRPGAALPDQAMHDPPAMQARMLPNELMPAAPMPSSLLPPVLPQPTAAPHPLANRTPTPTQDAQAYAGASRTGTHAQAAEAAKHVAATPASSASARARPAAPAANATARTVAPSERPRGPFLHPNSMLRGDFIAAVQQPGTTGWRVIERIAPAPTSGLGTQVMLLFVLGLVLLVPMAWWFSRALSAPIQRFAAAADLLGHNPEARPVPVEGPVEIAQAARSFNSMQQRINRMVTERTQMVAAIAHDLRTPLARLAFRLNGLPPALREKANGDIDEMKAMISAALDFIRDQSRQGTRERLDFGLLVESVVDDLADTGREVSMIESPAMPVVMAGDPLALRRMVSNLVDNALKYGRRARLTLQAVQDGCQLWVDDDGPGIDPAQHEQLFAPFFRGEASRNRDTGGIGLGLAAARVTALSHGGDIQLLNRAGGGLRAIIRLPLSEPQATHAGAQQRLLQAG